MKMNNGCDKYLKLVDSNVVTKEEVNLFNPLNEHLFKSSKDSLIVGFVGVLLKKQGKTNKKIISFPKYFFENDNSTKTVSSEEGLLLEKVLINICKYDQDFFNFLDKDNFPLIAYLEVCRYYKKYGLYHQKRAKYYKGYGGNIDWKRTVTSSEKILNNNNLVFIPFINKKIEDEDVFITECMNYVLTDGYNRFGKYLRIGVKYKKNIKDRIFNDNKNKLIKELVNARNRHFKNIEIKLLDNIIKYIKWLNKKREDVFFITEKFDLIWPIMVNEYLNKFFNYNSREGEIYFEEKTGTNYNNFLVFPIDEKKKGNIKKQNKVNKIGAYLLINDKEKKAFLIEVGDYNKLKKEEVENNKPICYLKLLNKYLEKYGKSNYGIVQCLVLPSTENRTFIKTKISSLDKVVKVQKCYLKVKDVMKCYSLKT